MLPLCFSAMMAACGSSTSPTAPSAVSTTPSVAVTSDVAGPSGASSNPTATPKPSPTAIRSQIYGEFNGWNGETGFKLANGQYWAQSRYAYTYHYAYRPKIVITPTGSSYVMSVAGVNQRSTWLE
jgi:hypothetical protein